MNTGWICSRCGASNAPMVARCTCVPGVTFVPAPNYPNLPWPWPWTDPQPHWAPTRPWYEITFATGGNNYTLANLGAVA